MEKITAEEIRNKLQAEGVLVSHQDIVANLSQTVLAKSIPWEGYMKADLITPYELELITLYDKQSTEGRLSRIDKEPEKFVELFLELLVKVNKEDTLQYVLTLIDQVITLRPNVVDVFLRLGTKKQSYPYAPFIRILHRSHFDWFTSAKASSILATLISKSQNTHQETSQHMSDWIRQSLGSSDEKDVCNAVFALQKILRKDDFRVLFATREAFQRLESLLVSKQKNFQLLYQIINALWLLTYNKTVATRIGTETGLIPVLVQVLKDISKEKVVRMCLATFRNLLDVSTVNNEKMLDAGLMICLENLQGKAWGDEDLEDDLKTLYESLQKNIVILSTFEMYKKEVMSGKLQWTPVHRSEKFWKENSAKFEENGNELLIRLKKILETSNDATTVSVAAYDIGEFSRAHPRGRTLVRQLNINLILMSLIEKADPEVKRHALLAMQKSMIHNWEYLSAPSAVKG